MLEVGGEADREPRQSERHRPRLPAPGAPPGDEHEAGDRGEAREDAGVVPRRDELQIGVGGEAGGDEEEPQVAQPDPGLCLSVEKSVAASVVQRRRRHDALDEPEDERADDEGRERSGDRVPPPRAPARPVAVALRRPEELPAEEEGREEDGGRLREGAGGDGQEVQMQAPRARRGQIEEEPADDAESAQDLGAGVHQVHGFGVDRVNAEERRGEESQPGVGRGRRRFVHGAAEESPQGETEQGELSELVGMEDGGGEPAGKVVIERQAERHEGAIRLVLRQDAEGAGVREEPPRVRKTPDVEVVDHDVPVVEMKGTSEYVRIGRDEKEEAAAGGREEPPGQARALVPRRLGGRAFHRCRRPGSFWTSRTTA